MQNTSGTPRQGLETGRVPTAVNVANVAAGEARATEPSQGAPGGAPFQAGNQQVPVPGVQLSSVDLGAVQSRGQGEDGEASEHRPQRLQSSPESERGEQLDILESPPVLTGLQPDNRLAPLSGQVEAGVQNGARPTIILRPDMSEEEMDEAATRLRPPSPDELATRLASRYYKTITGMLKRKVSYQTILSELEQGPDGSEFKEHFAGDHRKLGRYIREKCPEN